MSNFKPRKVGAVVMLHDFGTGKSVVMGSNPGAANFQTPVVVIEVK